MNAVEDLKSTLIEIYEQPIAKIKDTTKSLQYICLYIYTFLDWQQLFEIFILFYNFMII